ncbi:phosphotransferase-like protein [Puniceibacterium antarcticum]|uniref:phosphotransferase-like protein n=1 Tax=Puniceibacterium antarcticum TaxID=1206336 RepID=UPI003CCC330C
MTPPETLTQRETARGDRPLGSALQDHAKIHSGLRYDITLDGTADPKGNAHLILNALADPRPRSAFFTA